MLGQLKNSLKSKKSPSNSLQQSFSNLESSSSVFNPFPFPQESKPFIKQAIITQTTSRQQKNLQSRTARSNGPKKSQSTQQKIKSQQISLEEEDVVKIIEQSSSLIKNNQLIQGINLLKAMKDPSINISSPQLRLVIGVNLGVAYYQSGFLQQAFDEFADVVKELGRLQRTVSKVGRKLLYMTLSGKIQLQICILFSQLGNHEDALKHARRSCKVNFQLIYEVMNYLCKDYLLQASKGNQTSPQQRNQQANLLNNIMILQHLHKLIGQLNQIFHVPQKIKLSKQLLSQVISHNNTYTRTKVDMDVLYNFNDMMGPNHPRLSWIYNNKILDQIQLKSLAYDHFDYQLSVNNFQIVERITYLAISFYCYSTEIRFIEKIKKSLQQHDIMESEHWLSRSLEIAYSFLPTDAPILNQILTVHDRFHSIDKQTIPEDKEVCGYFKVLKTLSKPKSIYSSKSHACAPIMIRIQAPSLRIEVNGGRLGSRDKILEEDSDVQSPRIIELETFTKNNKIKGLNTRIKILQFNDTTKPSLPPKKTHLTEYHSKITQKITISDLSSIQTQRQKKERIAKIYKSTHSKTISTSNYTKQNQPHEGLKSAVDLQGKAIISEDLLYRPQSYDNKHLNGKISNLQQTNKAYSMTQSIKKRRSLSQNGGKNKQKMEKIVYNGSVKLDGLKLTGKRMNENFQIDSSLLEKLTEAHNNNDQSLLANAQNIIGGGNIFINNNINFFISKNGTHEYPQTSRQDSQKSKQQKISKRQRFTSRRRSSHSNVSDGLFAG